MFNEKQKISILVSSLNTMLDTVLCLRHTWHRRIQRFESWFCFRRQAL